MSLNISSLDPPGELLALTTYGNTKNLIVGALDLAGPLDLEALKRAVGMVGERFPRFTMCLKEVKHSGRHYLVWQDRSGMKIPFTVWDAANGDHSTSGLDTLIDRLEPSLDRDRNLFREPPGEVHLLRLAPERHVLASVINHVAADAIAQAEITKEVLINYHEIVTGQKPTFSGFPLAASTVRKRATRRTKTVLGDYWRTFRQGLIPYDPRCALPAGSGRSDDPHEHHVKRLLSQDESEQVVAAARKRKVALVDCLMANASAAVVHWNKVRGKESRTVTAALTVNMQRRFETMDGPNSDSVLYFRFGKNETKDPEKLARLILFARISQYRHQMDLKYYKAIAKLNDWLRVFPYRVRQRACVQILQRHQTSFALGFMGVLWPAANERRITGDSFLTESGGLSVAEVHGMAYKLISRTPMYLSVYFFRKRLNIILSAAAWHFTKEESQAFLDLLVELLTRQASCAYG